MIPQLVDAVKIPVIAAGGISDGRGILAALALGAEGVQIGTRFAVSEESAAHANYKRRVIEAKDNDTMLILKKIGAARMIKNEFTQAVYKEELNGANENRLKQLLGEKRERIGIFEGDEVNGMMEAGQGAGLIKEILPIKVLMEKLIGEYDSALQKLMS